MSCKTSKLIYETNRWTGSSVLWFLLEGRSEQIMIFHLCGCGDYFSSKKYLRTKSILANYQNKVMIYEKVKTKIICSI